MGDQNTYIYTHSTVFPWLIAPKPKHNASRHAGVPAFTLTLTQQALSFLLSFFFVITTCREQVGAFGKSNAVVCGPETQLRVVSSVEACDESENRADRNKNVSLLDTC